MFNRALTIIVVICLFYGHSALADSFDVDAYVAKVQKAFQVPGVAIGIIHNEQIVLSKGYGITDLENPRPVNSETLFKIASNTKAFTATSLAILVDDGKLQWSDKLNQYLSDFELFDSYASVEFTPIDLLTHRSGLGLGAGDLMLWPEPTNFSRSEVVKNLRYLKPVYGFREQYAYDNTLYIVAGELIAKITGKPWEQAITEQIFKPLNMQNCYAGGVDTSLVKNVTAPHVLVAGELKVDTPNRMQNRPSLMAAAGGIKCSLQDLLVWVNVLLNDGMMPAGERLYSKEAAKKMWTAMTPMRVYDADIDRDKTHFRAYGLGWRLKDYHGLWQVSHTGTLSGTMSEITLFPRANFGVIVLLNQFSGYARAALTRGLVQEWLDLPKRDWVAYYLKHQAEQNAKKLAAKPNTHEVKLPDERPLQNTAIIKQRLGKYTDLWFGEISLYQRNGNIELQAQKVPRLRGQVFAYDANTWWVKWHDRSFRADAWLHFETKEGQRKLTMTRILEKSDWSFNFQDLLLTQQKDPR